MVSHDAKVDAFTEFVSAYETRLRHSLIASFGGEAGRDAAAEALIYGWEHWDRVGAMDNPAGYLYKVGLSRGRRALRRGRAVFPGADVVQIPDFEPQLPEALGRLSERQRTVVLLVHCFQWTQSEVAELLGVSKTTVQNHLERGMARLRRQIGGIE